MWLIRFYYARSDLGCRGFDGECLKEGQIVTKGCTKYQCIPNSGGLVIVQEGKISFSLHKHLFIIMQNVLQASAYTEPKPKTNLFLHTQIVCFICMVSM